jgi:hypothetical protein
MLLLAAVPAGLLAEPGAELTARVEAIFSEVRLSDCEFFRNGKAHDPEEAEKHMRRKFEHFSDEIDSVDKFIELAGTRSLMSGRPYTVRCPGQPERPTAEWLKEADTRTEGQGS